MLIPSSIFAFERSHWKVRGFCSFGCWISCSEKLIFFAKSGDGFGGVVWFLNDCLLVVVSLFCFWMFAFIYFFSFLLFLFLLLVHRCLFVWFLLFLTKESCMTSLFFRLWKLLVRFGCYRTSTPKKTLLIQMTPECLLRWTMTWNSCFGELNCLVIWLTLRGISRRMGWSLPPTLLKGGPGQRFMAFRRSPSQRRRSTRSPRGQSWQMPIFQSFSGTWTVNNSWSFRWAFGQPHATCIGYIDRVF